MLKAITYWFEDPAYPGIDENTYQFRVMKRILGLLALGFFLAVFILPRMFVHIPWVMCFCFFTAMLFIDWRLYLSVRKFEKMREKFDAVLRDGEANYRKFHENLGDLIISEDMQAARIKPSDH